jgi:hypothetical protein
MDSTVFEDEPEINKSHYETLQLVEANEQVNQNAVNTSMDQHNVIISSVKSKSTHKTRTNMPDAKEVCISTIGENSGPGNSSSPTDAFTDNGWSPNIPYESQSAFTGYTFVRKKRPPSRRVVLANIKARDTTFERVKSDIVDWCGKKNVNVFGIFLLAHHSKRKFPTFVIRANIAEIDYTKTQEPDFWPETISARDWIVRNEKNPGHPDHSEDSEIS